MNSHADHTVFDKKRKHGYYDTNRHIENYGGTRIHVIQTKKKEKEAPLV
jgi:hypothetical protein